MHKRSNSKPVAVAALLSIAVLAGCNSKAEQAEQSPPPPAVEVAEVVVRDISLWDSFTGRIEAVESVEIRPRVDGYIERINYREGEEVEQGTVLFVIDQRPYRAALARAEAELTHARARAELAKTELARAGKLVEVAGMSVEELDQRRAAAAQTAAEVQAAQAAVDTARLNLGFTEIRAPIAGRTGRALVTVGNLVTGQGNATLLTTLVSLDKVHVHFFPDEGDFLRYEALARASEQPRARSGGAPVRIGLASDDGYPHPGLVDFIDNRLDPATGTMRIRAVLDNADRRFTPGMYARVQLLGSDSFRALLINDRAVLTDQDRKYVYVVDANGRAVRKDVVLGRKVEGLRVVEAGLEPGDRVIVNGVQRVFFPGMPVVAEPAAMVAAVPQG
jgi:multidrug efflux system membrane fusion protein